MKKQFVLSTFDLDFKWEGLNPSFRVYVDRELFCERKYIWNNDIITVTLQILAAPGTYPIEVVPVNNCTAEITVLNNMIRLGNGRWIKDNRIEIYQ